MDHIKELEYEVLGWMLKNGEVKQEVLEPLFGLRWNECRVVFQQLADQGFINRKIQNFNELSYNISDPGVLKLKALQSEKEKELQDNIKLDREESQGTSRTNWTMIIGGGTLLLILMTAVLIYLEVKHSKSEDSSHNPLDSAIINRVIQINDSIRGANFVHSIDAIADSGVGVPEPPPPPPPDYKRHSKKQIDSIMKKRSPTLQGDEKK